MQMLICDIFWPWEYNGKLKRLGLYAINFDSDPWHIKECLHCTYVDATVTSMVEVVAIAGIVVGMG